MSRRVQLSENEVLNRKVLSSRRKVWYDETVRMETGRVFHVHAPATGNTRSPKLDRLVVGSKYKVDGKPDFRRRHGSMLDVRTGVHSLSGNQWRNFKFAGFLQENHSGFPSLSVSFSLPSLAFCLTCCPFFLFFSSPSTLYFLQVCPLNAGCRQWRI